MVYNILRFYSGTGFHFAIGYLLPLLVTDTSHTPERNGMNCSANSRVQQAASIPPDSPSSPTFDRRALFKFAPTTPQFLRLDFQFNSTPFNIQKRRLAPLSVG